VNMDDEKKKKWYEHFVTVADKNGNETIQHEDEISSKDEAVPLTKKVSVKKPAAPDQGSGSQFVLTEDYAQIFQAAEIQTPEHGYNIYKVMELLDSDDLKSMTPEVKKSAITTALKITKVDINDIIKDAVARDKALDAYESMKEKSIKDFKTKKLEENQAIQSEIEEFLKSKNNQIETNNKASSQAEIDLSEWQKKKQAEEQKIYDAVSFFISPNPITLSKTNKK
jgi:hypothetical protein